MLLVAPLSLWSSSVLCLIKTLWLFAAGKIYSHKTSATLLWLFLEEEEFITMKRFGAQTPFGSSDLVTES